jgi:N6-L-threonylcarbamoyladenine synthase
MLSKSITLLAIESSCDDTSAAVVKDGKILANIIAGQKVHEEWGGVVPELASRAHQQNIVPTVDLALKRAGVSKKDLDAICFTAGPGLIGSLLVGVSFAKSMALALNIPIIKVHHMKAHVLAHFIPTVKDGVEQPMPQFPFLCLTVSGGHTQIVLVKDYLDMEVIGSTIDDAAGEAFDKAAKLLGFPYPGGPLVDKHAKEGNPLAFEFGEPQIENFDFSFSGVKTSILYFIEKQKRINPNFVEENLADLCASIQHRIVSILMKKLLKAAKHYNIKQLAVAGGVSANSGLRKAMEELKNQGYQTFIPEFQYCTDNAGMIAITGYYQYLQGDFASQDVEPTARWTI